MSFDALVTNPGRLRILTALAARPARPFVELRNSTGLSDGNLSTHARKLASAGLLSIEKSIASGKPLTTLKLTALGRDALAAHAHALLAALEGPARHAAEPAEPADAADAADTSIVDDDWVD